MNRFASALSQHPIPTHAVGEAAGEVIEALDGEDVDLVVRFVSPHFVGAMEDISYALRNLLEPRALLGMTAVAVIGGPREVEDAPALSLFAACVPDARLTTAELALVRTHDGNAIAGWPTLDHDPSTLILMADPFTFPVDALLPRLNEDRPGLTVVGGAASAARGPGGNRLLVDDSVTPDGAVGVLIDGIDIRTVVSQGCRPVGEPFVVTRAARSYVNELGGRPALSRLQDCAESAGEEDRMLMRAGLHLGVVVNEHQFDFDRGDFLVRNVMGIDERGGGVIIAGEVEVGQTVQFHVRDAAAADDDLRALLADVDETAAALLFTCNGRGRGLFGVPDHDAGLVDDMLGPLPIAGAFCGGEIGPIGGQNFLHGFTASLALF